MNLRGKKLRPQKRRGSKRRISTQDFDCQFITRDCESEIITDGQNITDDCESEIITDDCEGEIITQGCEGEGHILRHSFDCLNEDGILCSILSSLPLREAVRTCVLSRRWRHIWTYLPILNFDHHSILDDETIEQYKRFRTGKDKCFLLLGKTDQFIRTVDAVLHQHSCHVRVEEFLIQYFLCKPHSHHLDAWLANLPQCSASFIHLKRLDWDCPKWSLGVKMNLPHLDMLLDAAPFLEELKLRLSTCGVEEEPPRVTKLKKKLTGHPRPHLKSIEISGFHFERWQVQLVLYLLKSAIGLESMKLEKGQEISETDMNSLIQQVPPNVKLIIS